MSYRWPARTANYREWTHDTIPMTSIMVLERALNICGFHVRVDGKDLEKPMLFDELRYARERITMASEVEERIAAYEAYIDLIARFDMLNTQLPDSISLEDRERPFLGISLRKNLLGYTAYGVNRHTNSITTTLNLVPSDVKKAIRALNKAYKSVARDLVSESRAVQTSLTNTLEREWARKMIEAERSSYRESIKKAKEKIHKTLVARAKEEGYEIKKNTFRKGKNAGREQYVLVRRT